MKIIATEACRTQGKKERASAPLYKHPTYEVNSTEEIVNRSGIERLAIQVPAINDEAKSSILVTVPSGMQWEHHSDEDIYSNLACLKYRGMKWCGLIYRPPFLHTGILTQGKRKTSAVNT